MAVNLFGSGTAAKTSITNALGALNLATNLVGDRNLVDAIGVLNNASNTGGNDNRVFAGDAFNSATGSVAFNAVGSGNKVNAYPGPLAVAGAVNQNNVTVTQASPGINLYTRLALGASAVRRASKTSAPTATAVHTGARTAAPAASGRGSTKR